MTPHTAANGHQGETPSVFAWLVPEPKPEAEGPDAFLFHVVLPSMAALRHGCL